MYPHYEVANFDRDVEVIQIPSGDRMVIHAGTSGVVTQALGNGGWTIVTNEGFMVRLDGKDADAIGKEPPSADSASRDAKVESAEDVEQLVWDELRTCYDPEIPVNIADLGLVYKNEVTPLEEGGYRVYVEMTVTAPGCGMGDYLKAEAQGKIEALPQVREAEVEVVFDPPWDPSMMPEEARLQLGMM
ncbi:MAG: hypothetical protein QOF51_1285 [Chloroflexota bacterium]|jgi:probable FeS assembly SUF system protein SufT|nr:hypothetical protein [Chloroflexota bacterium]